MKSMKVLVPLIFIVSLFFPMALFAQEATPEASQPLMIMEALEIVRGAYGDAVITEISFEGDEDDDDEFQTACWHFEFADGTELCVDAYSGEITVDDLEAEETPEADDDGDDADDDDDSDDGDDADDDDSDDADDDDNDDNPSVNPAVSLEEAIAIALGIYPDSTVTNTDLEIWEDGTLVWDIELDNDIRSVDVDAMTGAVLGFGYEEDDDNSYQDDDDVNDDDVNDDDANDDDDSGDDDDSDDANDDDDEQDDDSDDDDDEQDNDNDDNGDDD